MNSENLLKTNQRLNAQIKELSLKNKELNITILTLESQLKE